MESPSLKFLRRLGPAPHANGRETPGCDGCPDLWELENGDIAVIGIRITTPAKAKLPATAGCGLDEEVVLIPRDIFLAARDDISRLV